MTEAPFTSARTASPASIKQVTFDPRCQVIPEGDCAELRKLLSLCPARAQSPPIVAPPSRSASLIARAISPQFSRSKSPRGSGNAVPSTAATWKARLTSWGNVDTNTLAGSLSAAFGAPTQSSSTGPRLIAPVPARGTASPIILSHSDDEDDFVRDFSTNESLVDLDDVNAEFQQAVSGVARHQNLVRIETVQSIASVSGSHRPSSPFARSVSEPQGPSQGSNGLRKSCLVRSKTPQAPGPPPFRGDGMTPLRATKSNDRESCLVRRRRADGIPVLCSSPNSLPEHEQRPSRWGADADTAPGAKSQKSASASGEKSKGSIWRRFRRVASEEAQRYDHRSSTSTLLESRMDDVAIKREIQAGRWPFEVPLNVECSCKDCQDKIEVGLASNYEPKWTRAARIRWLEAQEEAAAQSRGNALFIASAQPSRLPRSASRMAIQADEMAQLHNETVHPMTSAELEAEPTSPTTEQGAAGLTATAEEAIGLGGKPPNPTGLEEGDDTLRREIIARRQKMARQSPGLRHGARSMMRQIEEAERREQEAARSRSQSREGHRNSGGGTGPGTGSGRCSPASPSMSPSLPSTPDAVSTTSHEPGSDARAAASSYFELSAPPERVRSPLIPADVVCKARYAKQDVVDPSALSMANVASSLEVLVSPTASPAPHSPRASPAIDGKADIHEATHDGTTT